MNDLLLEHNLRNPEEGQDSEVQSIARARTLSVLGRVDSSRKKQVTQFLYEANLINRPQPVALHSFNLALTEGTGSASVIGSAGWDRFPACLVGTDKSVR